MNRRLSTLLVAPLIVFALAGCSSNPITVVEVDPADQVPTVTAEPTPSPTQKPTQSPTPTATDASSQRLTCDGKDATIVSTKDFVKGTAGTDIIVVRSLGDIVVDAGAGNDAICVFTGTYETPKSVTVFAGTGNDRFYGSDGVDHFFGGSGNDEANSYAGNDTLFGGAGNDKLRAGDGDDYVRAGDGSDVIYAGAGTDVLAGDAGEDTLNSEEGSDVLYVDKADRNQTDATREDNSQPTTPLAQFESQQVATLSAKATTSGWTIAQGSGDYAGFVIAKNSAGAVVAATAGKK